MKNREGIKWVGINIYSNQRAVGKTTIAMTVVRLLRQLGYKVIYEGINTHSANLIEHQIKRTESDPIHIVDATIYVDDKNFG